MEEKTLKTVEKIWLTIWKKMKLNRFFTLYTGIDKIQMDQRPNCKNETF